jgi:hypothetical protein
VSAGANNFCSIAHALDSNFKEHLMRTKIIQFLAIMIAAAGVSASHGTAQECGNGLRCAKFSFLKQHLKGPRGKRIAMSLEHPAPLYAHSRGGLDATQTHHWNQTQAANRSWHGGYSLPAYGQPMALLVPPTASFHGVYSEGVGNTQSLPIYHQFGRAFPGPATGAKSGMYHSKPQQPRNTMQFGMYYLRAPW